MLSIVLEKIQVIKFSLFPIHTLLTYNFLLIGVLYSIRITKNEATYKKNKKSSEKYLQKMNFQYVANYTAEISVRIFTAFNFFKTLISKSTIINSQLKKYLC